MSHAIINHFFSLSLDSPPKKKKLPTKKCLFSSPFNYKLQKSTTLGLNNNSSHNSNQNRQTPSQSLSSQALSNNAVGMMTTVQPPSNLGSSRTGSSGHLADSIGSDRINNLPGGGGGSGGLSDLEAIMSSKLPNINDNLFQLVHEALGRSILKEFNDRKLSGGQKVDLIEIEEPLIQL